MINEKQSFEEELIKRINILEQEKSSVKIMTRKDYIVAAIIIVICLIIVIGGGVIGK